MPSIRPNAIRIKRFRDLKADLRTNRDRLLLGIDIGKAQDVAQLRVAHTRIVVPQVVIPNTTAGFTAFWRQVQQAHRATGCGEIVCALEPTGTSHQALALFLEAHGGDVVLVSNAVAHLNRRTQDGTWDKSDPKDAANLCALLEQGQVLVSALPEGPFGELRTLVKLLRQARTELAACQARWRNTLRPARGPAAEPLPARVHAALPARLRAWEPAPGPGRAPGTWGPGLSAALRDLAARVAAAAARIGSLEAVLTEVAAGLPASPLLLSIPGVGPTVAAIRIAEIGDLAWDHQGQPAPEARRARHRPAPVRAGGRDAPDLPERAAPSPMGVVPSCPGGDADRGGARGPRAASREARRRSARRAQGPGRGRGPDPPDRLGRVAAWAALRSDPGPGIPYGPLTGRPSTLPVPCGSGERAEPT